MPPGIKIAVNDRSRTTLEVTCDEGLSHTLSFDPDQLLTLIRDLGHAHQEMVRGQEIPPLVGQRVEVVTDTRWAVGSEQLGEATLISFQHPAYGPVSFMIPIEQTERIAQRMLSQVDAAKASRALAN